jgi:carboxyl-terminal processing protease
MEQGQLSQQRSNLSYDQRSRIFDKVYTEITKHYFDPKFNGTDWPALARSSKDSVIAAEDPEAFEMAMHDMVRRLKTSHTGFFHQSVRRVPARLAIGATFTGIETIDGAGWIVEDVHTGGPAQIAGLLTGDLLISVDGKALVPPEQPTFAMGTQFSLAVRRGSEELNLAVVVPAPRSRKQPYCEPTPVLKSTLDSRTGYLKVTIFPGLLGLNVAREIDAAVAELAACDRLILDLRGHLGGGLGVLRLMSYLTPNKIPIGFTLSRKRAESGYNKEELPKLDRLPTHLPNPLAIASLALKFGGRDSSVAMISEGLGPQKWHGRIAILVNQHTISAGEMIAAFAAENRLATIVGTETAGRLIPGSGTKVGEGYMLIMPRAEYITWGGQRFEGRGVEPNVEGKPRRKDIPSVTDDMIELARRVVS